MLIGDNIAQMRKSAGYTQENLAEKLEVSRISVSSWETNKCLPDTKVLLKLAELLHCSVDELLRNNANPTSPLSEQGRGEAETA